MEEIWKDIEGYVGLYQISNMGNVKSLTRDYNIFNGDSKRIIHEHILKQYINKQGYFRVVLSNKCKHKKFFVHRLVALAFLPNPFGYSCINHKDENPKNNMVNNLEWCTHKYNSNYGTIKERLREKHLNHPSKSCPIEQLDKNMNHIAFFPSIHEAERQLSVKGNDIWQTCAGLRKSAKGYIWRYI